MRGFLNNYLKTIITIIIVALVLIMVGIGVYFLIKRNQKTELSKEAKTLQGYSAETGKNKFDLTGEIIDIQNEGKEIKVKIITGSKTVNQSVGGEISIAVADFAYLKDKDLKVQDKIDVKGSLSGNDYTAEYIARL